jgi:serine O-acetyltransferase
MDDREDSAFAPEWDEPDATRPVPFWASVRADIIAHVPPSHRRVSRPAWAILALRIFTRSAGFHVTFLYRIAHAAYHHLSWPGRVFAGLNFWFLRHFYGCSIASTARLYGGLMLPHPQGLVIGPGSVIGPRTWVFQNVTFGGAPNRSGLPRAGQDVRIYAGAVLAGPIRVGDNVMIGANAVVSRDVPHRSVVRPPVADISPLPEPYLASGE